MRRVLTVAILAILATLAACGGDSSTAPKEPTFPAMAGVYAVSGTFTATGTRIQGTITLVQPSREQPTLAGSCNLTVFQSTNTTFGSGSV